MKSFMVTVTIVMLLSVAWKLTEIVVHERPPESVDVAGIAFYCIMIGWAIALLTGG